jgi:hypothetical protein
LYLAHSADEAGLEPSALGELDEPSFRFLFRRLQTAHSRDWRSVLAGYASLGGASLEEALKAR